MNIYLYQDGKQTGPFTEEQVQRMLQTAAISRTTLGWREGMAGWEPLSAFHFTAPAGSVSVPPPPPPPAPRRSLLGVISFVISLVALVGWIILLTVAGMAHNSGTATKSFNMGVGIFVLLGLTANFGALVVGVVGAFKNRSTMAILGAALNAFIMISLVILMIIGLAMRHPQPSY